MLANFPRSVAGLISSELKIGGAQERRRGRGKALLLTSLLCGAAVFGFILVIVWIGFKENTSGVVAAGYTLQHYRDLFSEAYVYRALLNTFGFAGVSLAVAFAFAIPLAWIVERPDLPGRQIIYFLMIIGVLVPGLFTAMGWMFLLHPQIGVLNAALQNLFGFAHGPLNIVSVTGMGFVQGLGMTSIAFIILAPSYRALHPTLEKIANGQYPSWPRLVPEKSWRRQIYRVQRRVDGQTQGPTGRSREKVSRLAERKISP